MLWLCSYAQNSSLLHRSYWNGQGKLYCSPLNHPYKLITYCTTHLKTSDSLWSPCTIYLAHLSTGTVQSGAATIKSANGLHWFEKCSSKLPRKQDCHFWIPRSVAPVIITDQEADSAVHVRVRAASSLRNRLSVLLVKTTSSGAVGPRKVDHRAAPWRTLWSVDSLDEKA